MIFVSRWLLCQSLDERLGRIVAKVEPFILYFSDVRNAHVGPFSNVLLGQAKVKSQLSYCLAEPHRSRFLDCGNETNSVY